MYKRLARYVVVVTHVVLVRIDSGCTCAPAIFSYGQKGRIYLILVESFY
jgi:hypothetical protein